MGKIFSKDFAKNIGYAFGAQLMTLCLSILMSLVVPKILGVTEFSYWQLFIFYSTYVGFFHFGLTDGVYLKLGGQEYEKLDTRWVASQFWILCFGQVILAVIFCFVQSLFVIEVERRIAIIAAALYMLVANLTWYIGYVFQATNQIKKYSLSVVIDRAAFFIIVIIGFFVPNLNATFFIATYVFTKLLALIYSLINSKDVIGFDTLPIKQGLRETCNSIKIGINLTISSVSSIFTLGIGRMVVDNIWGIQAFGKFSFAISLTNFFLTFISQVSLVLFPSLRRAGKEQLDLFYDISRRILGIILPVLLVFYIPIKCVLGLWLPQYSESLQYLALLLPLCTFDGKMQLLCNTFFKVLRKEKILLYVNLLCMGISIFLAILGGYIFKSINFIVVGMVIAVAFRSIISEIYLSKVLKKDINELLKYLLAEVSIVVIFMLVSWNLSDIVSFIIMVITYLGYLCVNKESLKFLFERLDKEYQEATKLI